MASDEDFILYDVSQSAAALAACGRPDIVRHDGSTHSDEAESSQKPYSAGDARDEYSEDRDFCGGHPGSLAADDRLHSKALEVLHGGKGLEGLDGRILAMHSDGLLAGMNGGRLHRRHERSIVSKRKDRDETSDGGTYFKKGKINAGDGNKKDREEWSDGAISCLLDAYTEKYLQLNRGNLRGSDWEEVAAMVSDRSEGQKPVKTVDQCKNKVDSLKKRYKTEKNRVMAGNGMTVSYWPWFKKVDQIAGTGPKLAVMSDDEKEGVSGSGGPMKNTTMASTALPNNIINTTNTSTHNNNNNNAGTPAAKRLQAPIPMSLGLVNTSKKASSSLRWRRVLLKVSGKSLAGDCTQNVDPEIIAMIAREVASATQLGVEVAILVGGGNFFHRSSWVTSGGLDRASADHIGMMATVMNSILLQASLEREGVATRVQTAFRLAEVAEPYIRRRAIRHLEKGRVVIFGAGIGNPYFSTDTAAALRAAEINAEVLLKATSVDGIYDSDPKLNPEAVLLEHLSYRDMAAKGMDITAVTLCAENSIPVVIFNLNEPGNISRALSGEQIGTLVDQTGGLYQS